MLREQIVQYTQNIFRGTFHIYWLPTLNRCCWLVRSMMMDFWMRWRSGETWPPHNDSLVCYHRKLWFHVELSGNGSVTQWQAGFCPIHKAAGGLLLLRRTQCSRRDEWKALAPSVYFFLGLKSMTKQQSQTLLSAAERCVLSHACSVYSILGSFACVSHCLAEWWNLSNE